VRGIGSFHEKAQKQRVAAVRKALIPDLAPDAVAEIEFRFATLMPYLTA
jgi:hypothetical protein